MTSVTGLTLMTDGQDPMSDDEDDILHLEQGIPGLTTSERFLLTDLGDDAESAFQLLTAVDEPDVSIIVAVPWLFFPDYAPELPQAEQDALGITEPEQAVVFCPVTLDGENEQIHLNLLGPFVVNSGSRRGRQIVLADSEWPVRAAVDLELS